MTFSKLGGLAAALCAVTYIFGFVLLVSLLASLNFGTSDIDAMAVVAFNDENPGILTLWNTVIYVINSLALIVLVVALARRLPEGWAQVTQAIGLIWAGLVLGAGMIANVGVERAAHLYATDPEAAARLWTTMHAVELGLGGGNEIAGGVWILLVSIAAYLSGALSRAAVWVGLASGLGGLVTIIPPTGDVAGAVFGLGAILWFILVAFSLMGRPRMQAVAV